MTWDEVKRSFPDKFVKLQILKSHIYNNVRYIDEMAVIEVFNNDKEATRELVRSKDDILVYHTGKEKIEIEIRDIFAFRGAV